MGSKTKKEIKEQRPKVGVGVLIFKNGKVLLHQRKGSHGAGEHSFPGGHLEYMESFENCAKRETREECGIEIKNIRFQFLTNITAYAPKHYVHVGLIADWKSGNPKVIEPEKCAGPWQWYDLEKIPKPLFKMCQMAFDSLKSKKNYFGQK